MNYTLDEIKGIHLKKTILDGYSKKQVKKSLVFINEDYIQFVRDNEVLKSKVSVLEETLKSYKLLEESLRDSLLVEQKASEQIKVDAGEKAKITADEADMNAQKLISSTNQEVSEITEKYEGIKAELLISKAEAIALKAELIAFKAESEALTLAQLEVSEQTSVE